jgi:hypothetical protein
MLAFSMCLEVAGEIGLRKARKTRDRIDVES